MNLMLSFMITISLILLTLNHPLSMGLILIMQTLVTSIIIGFMMESFLFSYIIIIIMLSGALVLFIYMASVASNEKFNSPINMMIISCSFMIITFILLYCLDIKYFNNNLIKNDQISLIKLFNTMTAKMTLMIIIYLLLTMIVVSNIAKVTEGPLRIKN
uniref:NADH-ubiquinone oxidoreductase chain 6 n=1 Tax=Eurydema liturifera TaxID=1921101 RepID=A0A5C0CK34_9HEMI|nr:NADH dehydrogenase subunit 6 [Eurydema liturifera]QEI26489.1 NADH dehydrogenase subunit 6 [Eurydema liturifera]